MTGQDRQRISLTKEPMTKVQRLGKCLWQGVEVWELGSRLAGNGKSAVRVHSSTY